MFNLRNRNRALENWLVTVGLLLAVFGVVMAVSSDSHLFRLIFDPLIESRFWPGDLPPEAERFRAWVYGAWGGTVAGFGLLMTAIARPAISGGNKRLRLSALAALVVWFVVDSAASLGYGAWGNAVFINLPTLLALGLPLLLARDRQVDIE